MEQRNVRSLYIKANPGKRRFGKKGYWYRCAHCRKWCARPDKTWDNIPDKQKMEVDHIQSWINGGSDELWNLQVLCKPCNRSKSSKKVHKDNFKLIKNIILHPIDTNFLQPMKKNFRQNKVLKWLGIKKRR